MSNDGLFKGALMGAPAGDELAEVLTKREAQKKEPDLGEYEDEIQTLDKALKQYPGITLLIQHGHYGEAEVLIAKVLEEMGYIEDKLNLATLVFVKAMARADAAGRL